MVKSILSDMDSADVNSISDSVEAQQIASILEDTFYNLISTKEIAEHNELIRLTAFSDSAKPTHFYYPDRVKELKNIFYNTSLTTDYQYTELCFLDPLSFLKRLPKNTDNAVLVTDGAYELLIKNNAMPKYFTSFDDKTIVMDSFLATEETSLQSSKTRAYGVLYPEFLIEDSFEPDIDETLKPLLLAEAKSVCFSVLKAGSDPKIEQAARRLKTTYQNDLFKTKRENKRPKYGRNV